MTKDGGPAFPVTPTDRSGQCGATEFGMSLRDYFAAAALQGLIAADSEEMCCKSIDDAGIERERVAYAEQFAKSAYRYADAMLRERERKPE